MNAALAIYCILLSRPDLPPLEDLYRLPCDEIAKANCEFSDTFQGWCQTQASFDCCRADMFGAAKHEAIRLRLPWMWLVHARRQYDSDIERREALSKIRFAIGEDNYRLGILPPPVPLWRFDRCR